MHQDIKILKLSYEIMSYYSVLYAFLYFQSLKKEMYMVFMAKVGELWIIKVKKIWILC